jgi:phospholipid/cholesterol/gamma-HCH transport system ATP-binding protein
MIADYQRQFGFTALVVSHEIPDIFHIAQNIIMLDEGLIVFSGVSEEIQACQIPEVRRFIRGENHLKSID